MRANCCEFERCDTPTFQPRAVEFGHGAAVGHPSVILFAILACVAPLAPLLLFAHATFDKVDWPNNIWMIAYAKAYFSAHHSFPAVYNVLGRVGIPQPVFYGPLLYPILALVSQPFGVDAGIRLAVLLVCVGQFCLIYRLARGVGATVVQALVPAVLAGWAIYPLTNLYNRGALAEFFAATLLCCCVASGGLALIHARRSRRIAFGLLSALCAAEAVTAHGPTALMALLILPFLYMTSFRIGLQSWRARLLATLGLILIGAAIISPWTVALGKFSSHLTIETPNNPHYPGAGHWQRFAILDSWWSRLKPLPIGDVWTADYGRRSGTPYLDAQWNFPLVFAALWAIARSRRPSLLTIGAGLLGSVFLVVSVSPALQDKLPQWVGGTIQFPYRLVSAINLLALVALLSAWRTRAPLRSDRWMLGLLVVVSAAAMAIKLTHVTSETRPDGAALLAAGDEYLLKMPDSYNGRLDYTVQVPDRAVAEIERSRAITLSFAPLGVGPGEDAQPVKFSMQQPNWVITSIMNFPWNRLILDGNPVPFDQVHNLAFHEAVYLPAGEHWIGYRFDPDAAWAWTTRASWLIVALTAAAILLAFSRKQGNLSGA